jgi:NAD-dependent aldehyde dehydrogenases
MSKHRVLSLKPQLRLWRGTGWPERNKAARSFRQFRRFHHVINSNKVFGTHRVLAGGCRIGNRGYFFPLTVLADVPDNARAMNEEPFGPLALVNPVRNLDEAIEKANSLPYGLAAYAFTCSSNNAHRLANDVEAGNLSINHFVASVAETPFGGVKDSGYGREGGTEGLCCYTVAKSVSHKML